MRQSARSCHNVEESIPKAGVHATRLHRAYYFGYVQLAIFRRRLTYTGSA